MAALPRISILLPLYNEKDSVVELYERVRDVMQPLEPRFEILFVDDGSTDGSAALMNSVFETDSRVRILRFRRNFGKAAALAAGFATARGEIIVTLDGDLQNPPEEIPRLVAKIDEGNEVVGTWREDRHDPAFRRAASRVINRLTSAAVGVDMHDYGCMLRAYRRHVVDQIVDCDERSSFIPALANSLAKRTAEIEVGHAERAGGTSKYSVLRLMRLFFDLITGFSLLPIQLMSVTGILVALVGMGFGVFLLIRRFFVGPEVEGVFTLFAILFVFIGILILAVGLVGEYVGRIYLEVRRRPTYRIRAIHQSR